MENIDKVKTDIQIDNKEVTKFCAHCKKEIPKNNTKFKTRKFCSIECNRRFFSLQRYYKIKDTEKYKSYRKKYYKNWLDKNRDKFNASMRKASLKYQARKKVEKEAIMNEANKILNTTIENKGE